MERLIRKIVPVVLLAVFWCMAANAQKTMDVQKFSRLDNDLMARVTKPVRDHDEGKLCALIRVATSLTDLEVRADALGIVQKEQHAGELWLYVPYGAKSLSLAHQGYYPLLYQYPLPIEEGVVYELRLSSSDAPSANQNTQLFVLTHQPDEATVFIDDMEVPSENGVYAAMMSKGEHTYKVTADQYEEAEGTFELADAPVRESVKLQPLFGTFQILTQPEDGFNISVNGKPAGKSPYKSGRVEPGRYRIHIDKDGFFPLDTLLRLREGDNLNVTCRLTSHSDSLFSNRLLPGKRVSFGVNVGYLMPFASSSASGGFTGSPINYSLTDSREDVDYKSQSGFTAGIFADIRLYKNLFLIVGANYSQYKYSNEFNVPIANAIVGTQQKQVLKGDMENSYKEDYTLNTIEIPILASYRFVMNKNSSVHLNLGPYISYGLSAKMKLTGSTDSNGNIYSSDRYSDPNQSFGTYTYTYHIEGDFDLYENSFNYMQTSESGANLSNSLRKDYGPFHDSPFSKLNYGLKLGVTYEFRGFQLGAGYNLQLSNMANSGYYESSRIPIFNNQVGANNMSGYTHRIHSIEIKLGYVFRNYKYIPTKFIK
ncbi:MAG: outer membrane beta-barrel protein [Prevotella sp.]|nr:outer membrane beta-barrel protein [Prevotella sp.]